MSKNDDGAGSNNDVWHRKTTKPRMKDRPMPAPSQANPPQEIFLTNTPPKVLAYPGSSPPEQNNRRGNLGITFRGKTQTVTDWARELGLRHATIRYRLGAGWPIDRALTTRGRKY